MLQRLGTAGCWLYDSIYRMHTKEEIMATDMDVTIDNIKEKLGKLREYL